MTKPGSVTGRPIYVAIIGTPIDEQDIPALDVPMLRRDRRLKNGGLPQIPGLAICAVDAHKMLRAEPEEVVITLEQAEKKGTSPNIIVKIVGGKFGIPYSHCV